MGFELEKRIASELGRLVADDAKRPADESELSRPGKHTRVEQFKRLAAELERRLLGTQPGQAPGAEAEAGTPGKHTLDAGAEGAISEMAAAAQRAREALAQITRTLPGTLARASSPALAPARLDELRAAGLRDVLHALGGVSGKRRLQQETLAAADPAIAARASRANPNARPADAAGHALWRAAERRAATLYRHAQDAGEVAGADPVVEEALARAGSGHALPTATRKKMEAELGVSLERVRIHTDGVAAGAARAVRAQAFTVGEDIFFAEQAYAPESREGQKLLAHELAHVVQAWEGRTSRGGRDITVSSASDALELEAERVAERVDRSASSAASSAASAPPRARKQAAPPTAGTPASRGPARLAPRPAPAALATPSRMLMRRPAAQAPNAAAKPSAQKGDIGPNGEKATKPHIKVSRDAAKEHAHRQLHKAADNFKQSREELTKKVTGATKDSLGHLKHGVDAVKKKSVDKRAHAHQQNEDKHHHAHQKHAHDAAKKHHEAAKKHAKKKAKHHPAHAHHKEDASGAHGIQFKKISDWNKYMPEALPDQDARERKKLLKLVQKQVNGDRAASAKSLAKLKNAQAQQASAVRAMGPALQAQVAGAQKAALGQVSSAEAAQCGSVQAHVAGVTADVRGHAAAMAGQIASAHANALRQIKQSAQDAIQKLQQAQTKALADIDTAEASAITAVGALYTATKADIIALGTAKAGEASGLGDSISLPYDGDKLDAAKKAAHETAQQYASAMPDEASKAAAKVGENQSKSEADIRKMATEQRKGVQDTFKQCKQAIDQAEQQATTAANQIKTSSTSQVQNAASSTCAQLAAHGASQVAAIRQQAAGARSGITQAGQAAQAGIAQQVSKAASGIQKGTAGIAHGAKKIEAPNPEETHKNVADGIKQLAQGTQQIGAGLNKTAASSAAGLRSQASGAASGMAQTAGAANAAADQMGAGAKQSMSGIAQGAGTQLQSLAKGFGDNAKQIGQDGEKGMQKMVEGLTKAYDSATKSLGDGLKSTVADIKGSFDQAVPGQETTDILAAAKKAADAVKPWWQKALAVVASVVVAIVVVVVVTALIVTTGPVGAILVGAAAGALGSVAGTMASNLVLGNGLTEGITWQSVAMGAIGGGVAAGLSAGLSAGAGALATSGSRFATAGARLTTALEGGAGLGNYGIRMGVNVANDAVSDAASQLIVNGKYEFSVENLVTSIATNSITSTHSYETMQQKAQTHLTNAVGGPLVTIGTPKANGGGGGGAPDISGGPGSTPTSHSVNVDGRGVHMHGDPSGAGAAPAGGAHPAGGNQTAGGAHPAGEHAPGGAGNQTAGGAHPAGEHTPGAGNQTAGGAHPAGEHTPGAGNQTAGGAHPAGEHTPGAGNQNAGGAHPAGEHTGGGAANTNTHGGEHAPGEHAPGEHAPGAANDNAHGGAKPGEHATGEHGPNTPGEHAQGQHAPGEHAQGQHAPGEHAPGEHAPAGEHAPGEHAPAGEHAPGDHAAGGEHAGGDHAASGEHANAHGDEQASAHEEQAAAHDSEMTDLGYPQGTREEGAHVADAIEGGGKPKADSLRDTEANQKGANELEQIKHDPNRTAEEKAAIEKDVADHLRANEEPTGNLQREVNEAKQRQEAAKAKDGAPADGATPHEGTAHEPNAHETKPGEGKAPEGGKPADPNAHETKPGEGKAPEGAPAAPEGPTHDAAKGLADPVVHEQFAGKMHELQAEWHSLTPEQRAHKIGEALNAELKAQGLPEVKVEAKDIGARNGELDFRSWSVTVSEKMTHAGTIDAATMQSVTNTVVHEARHAEQWYMIARHMHGEGVDVATIVARTGMPEPIVRKAAGETRPMTPEQAAAAKSFYESVYGSGAQHRNDVINGLSTKPEEARRAWAEYDRINQDPNATFEQKLAAWEHADRAQKASDANYQDYRNLPEEADAWATGDAAGDQFGKTTPQSQGAGDATQTQTAKGGEGSKSGGEAPKRNAVQRLWDRIRGRNRGGDRGAVNEIPPGGHANDQAPKTNDSQKPPSEHAETGKGGGKGSGEAPRQHSSDLDQLYKDAAAAQVELSGMTTRIAGETGGKPLIPSKLKGRERAMEKINADYGGDPSRITDLARSSIEFDTPQQLRQAMEKIGQSAEIVRLKDRFEKPADGYRDVMMNLKMANGHIVEVQLHLKAILEVKNGPGHALYEQVRSIDARAKTEGRPLTAEEAARREGLVREMTALYDKAYEDSKHATPNAPNHEHEKLNDQPQPPPVPDHKATTPDRTAEPSATQHTDDHAPPAPTHDLPAPGTRVIRQDNDFSSPTNHKNQQKPRIGPDGTLSPAAPSGAATILDHVIGRSPHKDNSPFTSFMTVDGVVAKPFGAHEIELDVARLQADIKAGKVKGVEVFSPTRVQDYIRTEILKTHPGLDVEAALAGGTPGTIREYVKGLGISKRKQAELMDGLMAMHNTRRDGEWLIRGVVPKEYFGAPKPTAPATPTTPTTPTTPATPSPAADHGGGASPSPAPVARQAAPHAPTPAVHQPQQVEAGSGPGPAAPIAHTSSATATATATATAHAPVPVAPTAPTSASTAHAPAHPVTNAATAAGASAHADQAPAQVTGPAVHKVISSPGLPTVHVFTPPGGVKGSVEVFVFFHGKFAHHKADPQPEKDAHIAEAMARTGRNLVTLAPAASYGGKDGEWPLWSKLEAKNGYARLVEQSLQTLSTQLGASPPLSVATISLAGHSAGGSALGEAANQLGDSVHDITMQDGGYGGGSFNPSHEKLVRWLLGGETDKHLRVIVHGKIDKQAEGRVLKSHINPEHIQMVAASMKLAVSVVTEDGNHDPRSVAGMTLHHRLHLQGLPTPRTVSVFNMPKDGHMDIRNKTTGHLIEEGPDTDFAQGGGAAPATAAGAAPRSTPAATPAAAHAPDASAHAVPTHHAGPAAATPAATPAAAQATAVPAMPAAEATADLGDLDALVAGVHNPEVSAVAKQLAELVALSHTLTAADVLDKNEMKGPGRDDLVAKIKVVRAAVQGLSADVDPAKLTAIKGRMFRALQEASPYHSQGRNVNILESNADVHAGGQKTRTCNVTSLAMALEGLGKSAADYTGDQATLLAVAGVFHSQVKGGDLKGTNAGGDWGTVAALRLPDFLELAAVAHVLGSGKHAADAKHVKAAAATAWNKILSMGFLAELAQQFGATATIRYFSFDGSQTHLVKGKQRAGTVEAGTLGSASKAQRHEIDALIDAENAANNETDPAKKRAAEQKADRLEHKSANALHGARIEKNLPLEQYKKAVTEQLGAELASGAAIETHVTGHFVRLRAIHADHVVIDDPGQTQRAHKVVTWEEARAQGMFDKRLVLT